MILKQASTTKARGPLAVLSQPKFHRQGTSPEARTKLAKKILNELIVNAEAIVDTKTSYTKGPGTSFPNTNMGQPFDKDNSQNSLFQTPEDLRKLLKTSYPGMSDASTQLVIDAVFGTGDDVKVGRALKQKVWDLQMKLVNAGFPSSQAIKVAHNLYIGGGAKSNFTTTKRTVTHGYGGGSSTITDKIPRPGVLKKASVEIPAWAVISGGDTRHLANTSDNGLRDASTEDLSCYIGESIESILRRTHEGRQADIEYRNQHQKNILSASKRSEIPAHVYAYASDLVNA